MIVRLRWKQRCENAPNVIEISRRGEPRQGEGSRFESSRYEVSSGEERRERQPARGVKQREEPQVVTSEEMARGLSTLLWPASTVPMALAVWRMGQDLGFAQEFFLQDGLWSKWQVWFAASLMMMSAARRLANWKPREGEAASIGEAALEVVAQQADGHAGRRFGNLR